MLILSIDQVFRILKRFKVDANLSFVEVIDYEPDCKVYVLRDANNNQYALISRDFLMDDLEAEKRILSSELSFDLLDRFRIKEGGSYWFEDNSLDSFRYVFNLCRIKILSEK